MSVAILRRRCEFREHEVSEQTDDAQRDFNEKAWKVLNLQADTMLKIAQHQTEFWKVAVSAVTSAAALLGAGAAIGALIAQHLLQH
jgi:glycerol dehydrogenase-like iron-containing ADH family enzyme